MNVVLDASAMVEVVLERPHAERFRHAIQEAEVVLAPEVMVAEVTNAIWKYHRFEGLESATCFRALEAAIALPTAFVLNRELASDALSLSMQAKTPAYDMFYLALARREKALLLTMDAGLRKAAVRHGVRTA